MSKTLFALILMLMGGFACEKKPAAPYSTPLAVGEKKIFVEIVNTQEQMELGLSGRQKLTDEQGMLFDFGTPAPRSFWMKDMKFDIDIIWIQNKKIVGITANVPAPANCPSPHGNCYLPIYASPSASDMVLEVNAGWGERHNIKAGDKISF